MLDVVSVSAPSVQPSLEVSHRGCGEAVCVVVPAGEIDLASAPLLKSHLLRLLDESYARFVIDLSAVSYLDSTGLGVLIAFARRLKDEGLVVLAQPTRSVLTLLELTGLDASFKVFPTVEEAVADAGASTGPALLPHSSDAAIVIGLAATALPFAESKADELVRWIRILSAQGEAGRALRCAGLADDVPATAGPDAGGAPAQADSVGRVVAAAAAIATDRDGDSVSTVDLLLAVMLVYGETFERELHARGTSSIELIECLGSSPDPAS
jgi:anti-sigma B factor antagonist